MSDDVTAAAASPMMIRPVLAAAFWAALAFALLMALLPQPPHTPVDRLGDKFAHMLAFVVLTALGAAAYPAVRLRVLALSLSAIGALIEVLQAIPALHRDSDVRDWIVDSLAILAVLVVVKLWQRMFSIGAKPGTRPGHER